MRYLNMGSTWSGPCAYLQKQGCPMTGIPKQKIYKTLERYILNLKLIQKTTGIVWNLLQGLGKVS